MPNYQVGDPVIYLMTKQSSHPTLRATTVSPSINGDSYCYVVEKFWVVKEVREDGQLLVQTRRGKTRAVSSSDPCLKKANWWHRWVHRERFPQMESSAEMGFSKPTRASSSHSSEQIRA